ncbi:RcpC/CpaB family pilus assembly protein [Streptomyces sp. NPDC102406]|uniref:RcpC/CpaB family pilus assembly protein n=1 Tax=Streptomyces sp. NPDC102406 TaxID=3366171 RepID=UPI00381D4886
MSATTLPAQLSTPPTSEVPSFPPVRVRGPRWRPGRAGRRRRGPAVVAGLALAAAALAAGVPSSDAGPGHERAQSPPGERAREPAVSVSVSAPVRIADAGAVRLLRPGDRVDVVAARADGRPGVRVLASRARVTSVPEVPEEGTTPDQAGAPMAAGGSLVVLSVGRATAVRLAGAGANSRLAVTLW